MKTLSLRKNQALLGAGVLGPGAAFGWRQAAPLCGDRPALDAIRSRHVDDDLARVLLADLVHVRRAEARPHLGDVAGDARLDANVARLVVARLVARSEDGGELVEGQ